MDDAPSPRGDVIAVDQVGYLPDAEKRAVVVVDGRSFAAPTAEPPTAAEPDSDLPDATTFAVVDVDSGERVFRDELGPPVEAATAGRRVRHADFSAVTAPGTYEVRMEQGTARSHPFEIGADVYDDVLRDVGRLYALKRSGQRIADSVTGLELDPGHPQDAEAALYFDDPFHDAGDPVDVSGGWYDAGDYGKYVPPAAVAVAYHLLAYELAPKSFAAGQYELPAGFQDGQRAGEDGSRDGADADAPLPDLLAEIKFELGWLGKMQRPDGAVYHKVAGEEWTGWEPTPAEDDMDRFVFGLSTFGTGMYAGVMAMAARVFEPLDPSFAERALANAEAAFDYLAANPDPHFRRDEGQEGGSGPYDKETDAEERFWAAAELLRTTGDPRYAEYLESECAAQFEEPVVPATWADGRMFGQWAYRNAGREDAAGASDRTGADGVVDPDRRAAIEAAFVDAGEELLARIESDGYRISLRAEGFHWASTKVAATNGVLLALADAVAPRREFREAALDPLHYVLGRSPTGYSYVTDHGARPVRGPHDRLVASSGTPLPGMMVGGPNADGDDEVMADFVAGEVGGADLDERGGEATTQSPPPALAYIDSPRAYSVNEWAIDYSAPLVALLGYAVTSA